MPKLRHSTPRVSIARLERAKNKNPYGDRYRHDPVVYYLRFGDLVKIGTTVKIGQRIRAITNEGLMAVEFGDHRTERLRHFQYAHLRRIGEWFELGPEIGSHIVDLRQRFLDEQGLTTEDWLDERMNPA